MFSWCWANVCRLIRVIALRSMESKSSNRYLDGQQRFCLEGVDAQAELCLRVGNDVPRLSYKCMYSNRTTYRMSTVSFWLLVCARLSLHLWLVGKNSYNSWTVRKSVITFRTQIDTDSIWLVGLQTQFSLPEAKPRPIMWKYGNGRRVFNHMRYFANAASDQGLYCLH